MLKKYVDQCTTMHYNILSLYIRLNDYVPMKKYCNSVALKRIVSVYEESELVANFYPPEGLKKMIEDRAEDNMESVSKTVCKICREYFKQNPSRKRSEIKD
jgi:hypothetical protein